MTAFAIIFREWQGHSQSKPCTPDFLYKHFSARVTIDYCGGEATGGVYPGLSGAAVGPIGPYAHPVIRTAHQHGRPAELVSRGISTARCAVRVRFHIIGNTCI